MATTPVDLFRAGNKSSAKLDAVKFGPNPARHDLPVRDINGVDHVDPNTGGVSTQEAIDPNFSGHWYRMPAGTTYDDTRLLLRSDSPGHWLWEPARIMPKDEYVDALRLANRDFR
jgi:hypothetical protein